MSRASYYEANFEGPVLEDGLLTYWRTIINVHGLPPIDVVKFVCPRTRNELGHWMHAHQSGYRGGAVWTRHRGTAESLNNVSADEVRRATARFHGLLTEPALSLQLQL